VAEVQQWADGLEEIRELIGPRFARSEPRENAVDYVRGLLSSQERKNSWALSQQAGQAVPDRMQRLLSTTDWDPDAVRDDLRSYVVKYLGAAEGILIVDETGFLKKGTRSAGVARQYSGTAGRIENSQIGVFLTYSTTAGRALLDQGFKRPAVLRYVTLHPCYRHGKEGVVSSILTRGSVYPRNSAAFAGVVDVSTKGLSIY
jgi:SRSO17 transposase